MTLGAGAVKPGPWRPAEMAYIPTS